MRLIYFITITSLFFFESCSDNVKIFDLNRDQLSTETWLEVEKNEVVKICMDSKVRGWETTLDTKILNDSCLKVQVPTLIGVSPIMVKFSDSDSSHKINLVVGMKYLDFKNEEVLLGYNKELMLGPGLYDVIDPVKNVSVTGSYIVDKYPVTNCEFLQLMWDEIPSISLFDNAQNSQEIKQGWIYRKKRNTRNNICNVYDSATNTISLYQAMKYANARSTCEKIKPYYIFSDTKDKFVRINPEGKYVIGLRDFSEQKNKTIYVMIDTTSDGYRLPYYDEWMMFARAGDKTNNAPWGDSATYKDVLKYAQFDEPKDYYVEKDPYESGPVGQLKPNKYDLYDIFGLVEEHVLFEQPHRFKRSPGIKYELKRLPKGKPICVNDCPSSLKGGRKDENWTNVDYGFLRLNDNGFAIGGFRLIRNIGNNAKWSDVKSDKE